MNHLLKFYKDKITTFVYNEELTDFVEVSISELEEPLSEYFNYIVDIVDGVTVKDFLTLLSKYAEDINKMFSGFNHGNKIELYLNELSLPVEQDYLKECDEIEMIWDAEVVKEEGVSYIADWVTFCGRILNFKPAHEYDIPTRAMHIVPLRNWKDLPLKLNRFVLYQETSATNFKKMTTKLSGVKQFSFFNLLSGFIYELTYHGTPEQQIALSNDIKNQLTQLTGGQFGDGKVSFIPIDALTRGKIMEPEATIEELTEKMQFYIDNEEFEKAQEIKNQIENMKNQI